MTFGMTLVYHLYYYGGYPEDGSKTSKHVLRYVRKKYVFDVVKSIIHSV